MMESELMAGLGCRCKLVEVTSKEVDYIKRCDPPRLRELGYDLPPDTKIDGIQGPSILVGESRVYVRLRSSAWPIVPDGEAIPRLERGAKP